MNDQTPEKGRLSAQFQPDPNNRFKAEPSGSAQHYAVAIQNMVLKRFKLILRSGESYSLPYSLLPIYIFTDRGDLLIKSYGILITIQGRNLKPIEEALSNETLLWVKESPSGQDSGDGFVFIADIHIEGKSISKMLNE
uniref:Uncharacterized protein n=1 Tax=Roseihalotalea indica TaxID=2867963 RepID=A0AA49JEK4_9BACT|nr:hypothetical protein K4G66_18520 [Tunicatimonas sp. TK19036]